MKRVIPLLESFLLTDSKESARLQVAVSLAKLHSKLPYQARIELPGENPLLSMTVLKRLCAGLLLKLANLLAHRAQQIRDDARHVYVSVAVALGSQHLHQCIQSLIRALPMKGYTAHVLDHAIHAVRTQFRSALECPLRRSLTA